MGSLHYYEVAVALDGSWKENRFSYHSTEMINVGRIVLVPFGRETKIGYVQRMVKKPFKIKTKPIIQTLEQSLPQKTISYLNWLEQYYPGPKGVHLQTALPAFLQTNTNKRPTVAQSEPTKPLPRLTSLQTDAYTKIQSSSKPVVLYGITGSGKTRLYAELASETLKKKQNVIVLYPEISLTTQLQNYFFGHFGQQNIFTYHSKQTPTEQRKSWLRAESNEPAIFMGPRSVLSLPYDNIGLIIIDEAHDPAFKQDSGLRTSSVLCAAAMAKIHSAKLVLGSASPPVQETHQILSKGGTLVALTALAKEHAYGTTDFKVVDMREQSSKHASSSLISKILYQTIAATLNDGKQVLLFLNRRGTARAVLCERCGWHALCEDCDNSFIYHHDTHTLQCHICGKTKQAVITCPECQSALSQRSLGTKALLEEVQNLFPEAAVGRFDSDNKKKDSFSEQFEQIKRGDYNILIGTQLLTKGLDLPLLQTVGIIHADSQLLLPDYTSDERTFQQILQVSGRVGRGHGKAEVILQTYQPNNPIFDLASRQDWKGFYESEIERRKSAQLPPFTYSLKLWANKTTRNGAQKTMQKLHDLLVDNGSITLLGPAPSFYEKAKGSYSWQIIALSPSRKVLASIVDTLPKDVLFDLDPISLL